jgi:hypothetical protein
MLKKLIAGLSAVVLSLGLVALVAGPASAHTNTVNGSVACNTADGSYVITWTVKNSESDKAETITASSNTAVVPVNTVIAAGATGSYQQTVTSSGKYSLTVTGTWQVDNYVHQDSGSVKKSDFPKNCEPSNAHNPVTLCHATPPDTAANGWNSITVDDDAVFKKGHGTEHDADIIPAFDYWTQDGGDGPWTLHHFPGKNLTTVFYGQTGAQILAAGCVVAETPAAPSFTAAVCTGPGVAGNGSYTIPTTTGVKYSVTIDGVSQGVQDAGTYPVVPTKTVIVTASSIDSGIYQITGTAQWSFQFDSAGDCITTVTPLAPSFTDAVCTGPNQWGDGSFTIPATTGVQYQVKYHFADSYVDIDAGTYPVSAGTHVYVRAVALPGYALTDRVTTKWDRTIRHPFLCVVTIPNPVVTQVQAVCDGPGTNSGSSYTLPDETGVIYTVVVNSHWHFNVAPGTYSANPGDHVYILATGGDGYVLENGPQFWNFSFTDPGKCLTDSTPVDPSKTDQSCVVSENGVGSLVSGFITIPDTTGVQYYIDGTAVSAGDIPEAPGSYTVTATALPGYVLQDYPADGWVETIAAAELCGDLVTHPLVAPIVTVVQLGCSTNGSYTLSNDLADSTAVIWTVEGSPVAQGTYQVTSAKTVHVHADPNAPDFGFDLAQQTDWTLTFAAPTTCDLKTLALTGSDPSGAMLLAYFLLLSGLGVVAVRAVRRHGRPQE